MKVWIAVLILLVLAALILRERFETYEQALKDVGQSAGYITPKCESGYTLNSDESSCEKTKEDGTKEKKTPTCPSGSSFVTRGTRGVCEPSATPEAPSGTPSSQTSSSPAPAGGSGSTTTTSSTGGSGSTTTTSTGGSGSTTTTSSTTAATTSSSVSASTGGSSGNIFGPTSGGVGPAGKNIWGPVFNGLGQSSAEGGDSTKSNKYPGLLGGMMGRESTRIPGVGITSPSQPGLTTSGGFGLDLGVLPSSSSLGSDANSRFLPFSRPGMDSGFSSDPYRLAKGYSTKNYSPQPEPVPFLTDFSAFFR